MQLNAEVVGQIAQHFISSAQNKRRGKYSIAHDLSPELKLDMERSFAVSKFIINGYGLSVTWGRISDNRERLCKDIAKRLAILSMKKAGEESHITDMFNGISINSVYDTPFGLTVHYHNDIDSKTLMVSETGNPNNVIYASEEAINHQLSISPDLLTSSTDLAEKLMTLFADYILADRVISDIKI